MIERDAIGQGHPKGDRHGVLGPQFRTDDMMDTVKPHRLSEPRRLHALATAPAAQTPSLW